MVCENMGCFETIGNVALLTNIHKEAAHRDLPKKGSPENHQRSWKERFNASSALAHEWFLLFGDDVPTKPSC